MYLRVVLVIGLRVRVKPEQGRRLWISLEAVITYVQLPETTWHQAAYRVASAYQDVHDLKHLHCGAAAY